MAAPVLQFKRGLASNVGLASFRAGEPGFTTDKYDFYIGLDATATNQKFFGSARYWKREDATNAAQIKLVDKDGTNFIGIAASNTLSGIATYRLPNTTNGTTGDFLKLKSASGGYYDLEWTSVPSGSFSIAGDTGTDTFTTGETLTFAGTVKEIETAVTNNQVQIGLPNDVDITNNFKVTGLSTFIGAVTGTISTATRATTVDTTTTSTNASYYVPFVSNLTGTNGETLRVGAGLSINPSTGNVGVSSILSVGSVSAINSYIRAGGGSNAMFLYSNGDVSFQAKVIANNYRSQTNSSDTLTFSDLDATFARNVLISGIATVTGNLSVNGGTVTTSGTAATVFNTNATTVNAFGAANNILLGSTSGITTIRNSLRVTSNLYDSSNSAGASGQFLVVTASGIGWTTISGVAAGTISTATRANTVDIAVTNSQSGGILFGTTGNGASVYNDTDLTYDSNTNQLNVGILSATSEVRTGAVKAADGTTAISITNTTGAVQTNSDFTVGGNLYVNGSTTQVNTSQITVEDRTIELGIVDGSAPSSTTTWDLGVLFNYYDSAAKKSALVWEQGDARFKLGSVVTDGGGTGTSNPQITFTTYAALELGELWINNTCTGGSSQIIACSGSNLVLQNITLDAGTF